MNKEALYLQMLDTIRDGVYFVDQNRTITFWNKGAERITGYSAQEILDRDCPNSGLHHIDEDGRPLCSVGCPLFATLIDGKIRSERVFVRHKNGYRLPIIVNVSPIYDDDGSIVGAVEVFSQNSPKVYDDNLVADLSEKAMHDELTKLPNRAYLESFLNFKIEEHNRFGKLFAVLLCDIDNFRTFNNIYGHDVGDLVLKNISQSIKQTICKTDLFARWGGEEFVGIYSIGKAYEATIIAEKLRYLVSNTEVVIPEGSLKVTVSVGITTVRKGDTVQSLIKRADELMYESKNKGKNRVSADDVFPTA